MVKKYLCACFMLSMALAWSSHAQTHTISGKISNSTHESLPHVDVILYSIASDTTEVASTLSDENGLYVFDSLALGTYQISAYNTELNEKLSKTISLDSAQKSVVGDFTFEVMISKAEDVVIVSQKSLVRQDPDKMVVNVESSLSNSGLTGVDVLRKMPGISVDRDGRISLKGRPGVMVMLDDKLLYMSEEQLANLLKSLPSDLIKEIEIISSPSAKYDAVGNAGIINIRLKQGAYEGFNGSINTSLGYGIYHKSNSGANASYKKKKISLDMGYQYSNKENLSDFYSNRAYIEKTNALSSFHSKSYFRLPEASHTVFLKGQYQLSPKGTLSMSLNSALGKFNWDGGSISEWYKWDNSIQSSYESKDRGYVKYKNINGGADYSHNFDTLGTKMIMGFTFNQNGDRIDKLFDIQYFDSLHTDQHRPFVLTQKNNTSSSQYAAKVDFTKTLFKKIKFESGVKMNHVNDYKPLTIAITENNESKDGSNHFRYIEDIYASYAIGSGKIGKWSFQGGLRLEHTEVTGTQTIIDTTFTRSYTNLFPSGNISYKASEKNSYTLLYSKRIRRPSGHDLNPVLNIVDPNTAWGGDPFLLPEYTDNMELTWSTLSGYVITTLNYSHTKNPIMWVSRVNSSTLYTVSGNRNLESMTSGGLSVATNFPITKWWNTSNFVYVYDKATIGDLGFGRTRNRGMSWQFNTTQSFKLPKQVSAEVSGNYEAASAYALGRGLPFWQANISMQKKFFKDKLSVKVTYSDIFRTMRYRGETTYGNAFQKGSYRWDNRVLMLSLSYKFGKRLER